MSRGPSRSPRGWARPGRRRSACSSTCWSSPRHWLVRRRSGHPSALGGDAREPHLVRTRSPSPLDLRPPAHFSPLLPALAQYDRAALVDATGRLATVGAHLRSPNGRGRDVRRMRTRLLGAALLVRRRALPCCLVAASAVGVLARPALDTYFVRILVRRCDQDPSQTESGAGSASRRVQSSTSLLNSSESDTKGTASVHFGAIPQARR